MKLDKRGQVTIFIIVALAIVALFVLLYAFRGRFGIGAVPAEFEPVFDNYESCIEQEASAAIDLAGIQGGRVYAGEYVPGSEFAPFSSQLNFLGFPVPYWYYVSGNGVIEENIPSMSDMEGEIEQYIEERVNENCNFDSFYEQGFWVEFSEPDASVSIEDEVVSVDVNSLLSVVKDGESVTKNDYLVEIDSKLGSNYAAAREIYTKEAEEGFLEDYAIDVLNLYAPVDGVELQCGLVVWATRDVVSDIKEGLALNIGALKSEGNYYTINEESDRYFVLEDSVDEPVRFLYSENWPTRVEIFGDGVDGEVMSAEPVGNQPGLSVMGFCYVPYHFVYDVTFPVMVQVGDGFEMFQFPIVAIVDNNKKKEADLSVLTNFEDTESEVCDFKTEEIEVNVYDINLNSVDANISYTCFDQRCRLGETENGVFVGNAPACYNGQLSLSAEGYADKNVLFSSNEEFYADIVLDRLYDLNVILDVGGRELEDNGTAVITFESVDGDVGDTVVLPGSDSVELTEGYYNVDVLVYENADIVLPETSENRCFEVSSGGLSGLFGGTTEECVDVTIPEVEINYAVSGGGKGQHYFLPSQLESGIMEISVNSLPRPNSLEELQSNLEIYEEMGVNVNFG